MPKRRHWKPSAAIGPNPGAGKEPTPNAAPMDTRPRMRSESPKESSSGEEESATGPGAFVLTGAEVGAEAAGAAVTATLGGGDGGARVPPAGRSFSPMMNPRLRTRSIHDDSGSR